MDNVFITQFFDWNYPQSRKVRFVNSLLAMMGARSRLMSARSTGEQTSVEQRINLYHLATEILVHGVPGSFIEIGSYRGSTATLLQRAIEQQNTDRQLHVFDGFFANKQEELIQNFQTLGLMLPIVHAGRFQDTLPSQLPDSIAFVHLDANWGQSFDDHRDLMLHCLKCVYPRMEAGAICVIADYCESDVFERQRFTPPWLVTTSREWSQYPAVKAACDEFFADKPEAMTFLYGGGYSHGYFRKKDANRTSESLT